MSFNSFFEKNLWADISSDSSTNILRNCSYKNVSPWSSLTQQSFYHAKVLDVEGMLVNDTLVKINRANGELEAALRTTNGETPRIWVTNYINDSGVKKEFAPYTITAEKGDLSASHVYDPNGFNSEDVFILGE